jgi:hypothetical protein
MNKRTIKSEWINITSIMYASLTMILVGLLVSWGIELLLKELFRLG